MSAALVELQTGRQHGTHAKYVVDRCRCDDCRAANRDYERARKLRRVPPYVGADRARRHIEELASQGVGLKSVQRLSGLPHGTLSKLIYGDQVRGMGPSKRIRHETEQKILAVHAGQAPGGTREPAGPTWEIVAVLLERGWQKAEIGRRLSGPQAKALQLGREVVTREHARIIRSLLDEPVPPRRSRHGLHAVTQPQPDPATAPEAEPADEASHSDRYALPVLRIVSDDAWRADAACRHDVVPNWLFFPTRGDQATASAALDVCARCPVVVDCRDFALSAGITIGIWGATSERQRRGLRAGARP